MKTTRFSAPLALALLACGGGAHGGPTTPAPAPEDAIEARPLSFGLHRDTLTASDATLDGGRHVHGFALALEPGRRVRIRMSSDEVDPMLEITGPGDFRLFVDDAFPGTLDAMLDFVPPAAGRYELLATTASGGDVGAYVLDVAARGLEGVGLPLPVDGAVTGDLSGSRQPGLPGSWYHFEGTPGSLVRLRVTSADFDTVVTVIGPNGQTWVNDDAHDSGDDGSERPLDSTLVLALAHAGVHQVVVTGYGEAEAGAFRIATRTRRPVVIEPGQAAPTGGHAGPDARGRILGLYAGISDYDGEGDLYGCADDARFLAEAMRAASLATEADQRVLTDGEATREAFLSGVAELAARATPDDVVIVFWSGHGTVQPAPDGTATELDGLDETIALHDGKLTDTEVVAALDAVDAGTLVLAIDACHSGGFADDFLTRPGRVGVFSSDEDILSATAEPRRAGGYLSYHLRQAVLGHADARPRDGVLMAGELTDHLYAGFVSDDREMNPPRSREPLQRLVVRRGAVRWSDVLWVYPRRPDLSLPPIPAVALMSPDPG